MLPVTSAVGASQVPPAVRDLTDLADPDYLDLFTLTTRGAHGRPAEQWARTMFEDVGGRMAQVIWRGLLGMRLRRQDAPGHVAGWLITERGADWIRIEAVSWCLTGHLVVRAHDDQVSLLTAVRYDRSVAAAIWGPLSRAHRRMAPGLLRDASERLSLLKPLEEVRRPDEGSPGSVRRSTPSRARARSPER